VKIGLAQVAGRAEVSQATVSRVLNHRSGVAEATRERVQRAISELGFERDRRVRLVGIVLPGLSPLFDAMAGHIQATLAPHGLQAIVCVSVRGGIQERDFVASLAEIGATGVVFASASNTLADADTETFHLLDSRHIPYVCINGVFDGSPAPSFSTDDRFAADLAVRHLYGLGHRKIGLAAGPLGNRPSDLRAAGFLTALTAHDIADPEEWVVRQTYSVEGGQVAAESLLDRGTTAIVAASDEMALGAIRAVRRRKLLVPDNVSVVGYDDSPLMEFTDPPLTTIRQPVDRLAVAVARALVALIARESVPSGQLLFQPDLIVRASTAGPPR